MMLKKTFILIAFLFLLSLYLPVKAHATTAPTPTVSFTGSMTATSSDGSNLFGISGSGNSLVGQGAGSSGTITYTTPSFSGSISLGGSGIYGTLTGSGDTITYTPPTLVGPNGSSVASGSGTLTYSGGNLTGQITINTTDIFEGETITTDIVISMKENIMNITGGNSSGKITINTNNQCPSGEILDSAGTACEGNALTGTSSTFYCLNTSNDQNIACLSQSQNSAVSSMTGNIQSILINAVTQSGANNWWTQTPDTVAWANPVVSGSNVSINISQLGGSVIIPLSTFSTDAGSGTTINLTSAMADSTIQGEISSYGINEPWGFIEFPSTQNTISNELCPLNDEQCQTETKTPICPADYTLNSSNQCVYNITVSPSCPSGWTLTNGICSYTTTDYAPTASGYSLSGNECIETVNETPCSTGYTLNTSTGTCSQTSTIPAVCPAGFTQSGNTCTETLTTPATCPAGYEISGSQCVTVATTIPAVCPTGYNPDTASPGQCIETPTLSPGCPNSNYTLNTTTGMCSLTQTKVPLYEVVASNSADGASCADTLSSTSLATSSCPLGYVYSNGTCLGVAASTTGIPLSTASSSASSSCPAGYTLNGSECTASPTPTTTATPAGSCPTGYTGPNSSGQCTATGTATTTTTVYTCPNGTTVASSTDTCTTAITCPSGYTLNGSECTASPTTNTTLQGGVFYNLDGTQECNASGSSIVCSGTWNGSITFNYGVGFSGTIYNSYPYLNNPLYEGNGNGIIGVPGDILDVTGAITYNYSTNTFSGELYVNYNNIGNPLIGSGNQIYLSGGGLLDVLDVGYISPYYAATYTCPDGSTVASSTSTCTVTPTCSTGYTLSGSTCTTSPTAAATTTYTCPNGSISSTSTCTAPVSTGSTTTTYTCPDGSTVASASDICTTAPSSTSGSGLSSATCPSGTTENSSGDCVYTLNTTATSGSVTSGTPSLGNQCLMPVCPSGYTFNSTTELCTENTTISGCQIGYTYCPSGKLNPDGSCTSSTPSSSGGICSETLTASACPQNYTYNASANTCSGQMTTPLQCPANGADSNYTLSGTTCTEKLTQNVCPSGYTFNASTNSCTETTTESACPNGTLNGSTCTEQLTTTPICTNSSYYYYDSSTNTCQPLTQGPSCSSGYTLNGSECTASPTTNTSTSPATYDCPNGTTVASSTDTCTTTPICSSGYSYNSSNNLCYPTVSSSVTCPGAYTPSSGSSTQTESACPSGYNYDSSSNDCINISNMSACPSGFTLDTYTGLCLANICPYGSPQYQAPGQANSCVETAGSNTYYCSSEDCYNNAVNTPQSSLETLPPAQTNNGTVTSKGCSGSIYIFPGKAIQCTRYLLGNCCSHTKYMFGSGSCSASDQTTAQALIYDEKYSPPVPVYDGSGNINASQEESCPPSSIVGGDYSCGQVGETAYMGSYCSEHLIGNLGPCLATSAVFCKFSGLLATIIQIQGRAQLSGGPDAMSWGSAQSPNCSGFTPSQFQALNFSKMNLTEYINVIKTQVSATFNSSAINEQIKQTTTSITNEIQMLQPGNS